ncbi:MAG: CHC2 zinc finger domain-containing protein [Candidatus Acidiferrum sp.]
MSELEFAKQQLRIPDLWRFFHLPGKPGASCKSPFREDKRASFSVSRDGLLFNDFATNDAGDAIDFLQRAAGLPHKEAFKKFIELAGGSAAMVAARRHMPPQPVSRPRERPQFPDFEKGATADLKRLALLRNLSIEGLQLASERDLLWFAKLRDFDAWIVTDSERVNAQARRMDGGTFSHLNSNPKAWTLPGSWANWPIGSKESQSYPAILLCEGGPDLLAAFHFAWCEDREREIAPVAMLGAGQRIHEAALPLLAGKCIRIFPHLDRAGRQAAQRWARQLEGAEVDCFDFSGLQKTNGEAVTDLNDCASICADDFEGNRELWAMLP